MTKHHLHKNYAMVYKSFQPKKEKKGVKKFPIFIAVFLLAILTIFPSIFRGFSASANNGSVPFLIFGNNVASSFSGVAFYFKSRQSLLDENKALSVKLSKMEAELSGFDFVVQENLELKKNLKENVGKNIFAQVIARPNVTAYDTFLLDAGTKKGVKINSKILTDGIFAIGIIDEAYADSSKARLYSTSGQITNVLIGPNNIPVEIHGLGGGSFSAEVPNSVDIQIGDAVILAESSNSIIAIVRSEEKTNVDSFRKFYLQSPASLFSLKYVEIENTK